VYDVDPRFDLLLFRGHGVYWCHLTKTGAGAPLQGSAFKLWNWPLAFGPPHYTCTGSGSRGNYKTGDKRLASLSC
jgi:hypothetical protein